ncbi:MAG: hypothetical protein C0623_01720 [Desulfuromonas sp.]|nr:MAG: hypothetical protein C0623_01720 [Desulfuromonas sp.]
MKRQHGFTLVELLVVIAILGLLAAIAIPQYSDYKRKANYGVLVSEGRELLNSFSSYYEDKQQYPPESGTGAFDPATFDPLASEKYYSATMLLRIINNKADEYRSPGKNEFWLIATQKDDQNTRLMVINSNKHPLSGGKWIAGIYKIYNGQLLPP